MSGTILCNLQMVTRGSDYEGPFKATFFEVGGWLM